MSDTEGEFTDAEMIREPATAAETDATEVVSDDLDNQEVEGDEEGAEDDGLEDYEYEGKKARIPKEWREAIMRHADYTQKTQSVAERARAVEAEREEITKAREFWDTQPKELTETRGKLANINAALEEWKKVDFNRIAAEQGEDEASRHFRRMHQITQEKSELEAKVKAQEGTIEEQRREDVTKRLKATADHASKNIKGWTPEVDKELAQYAEKRGISREQWLRNASPQLYDILYDAYRGSKLQQKVTQTQAKPPPPPSAPPIPSAPNRSSPVRKDAARMDMDTYIAARKGGWKG